MAEPQIPDQVRQLIRSGAQAAAAALSLVIVGWLTDWLGTDAVSDDTSAWLTGVLVPLFSAIAIIAWIALVNFVKARLPWAEYLFVLRGAPRYEVPSKP